MIDLEKQGGLWRITIKRPAKANSLTKDMLKQLLEIAKSARAAKVLVITGHGNIFSSGADLDQARAGLATDPIWERLSNAVASAPCLTIAAINGTLVGGAHGMVLACDLRIAVPDAQFFYPVMKHGFLPPPSDPIRMRALIGPSRSKLILLAGQKINAEQALEYGLVDQLVSLDKMDQLINELSQDALNAKDGILSGIKKLCDK